MSGHVPTKRALWMDGWRGYIEQIEAPSAYVRRTWAQGWLAAREEHACRKAQVEEWVRRKAGGLIGIYDGMLKLGAKRCPYTEARPRWTWCGLLETMRDGALATKGTEILPNPGVTPLRRAAWWFSFRRALRRYPGTLTPPPGWAGWRAIRGAAG